MNCQGTSYGLSLNQRVAKRCVDIVFSATGLILIGWVILFAIVFTKLSTNAPGVFIQTRIGRWGKPFKIFKIGTMKMTETGGTTVTTGADPRITRIGRFFRKTKIDELPQLINVLIGQMSFVGPRPDVPGFADRLEGEDRLVLSIRPGITGPASLYFKNEEDLLSNVNDPEQYNKDVIYPKKVELNLKYIKNYSLLSDLRYIVGTVFSKVAPSCKMDSDETNS